MNTTYRYYNLYCTLKNEDIWCKIKYFILSGDQNYRKKSYYYKTIDKETHKNLETLLTKYNVWIDNKFLFYFIIKAI